MTSPAPPVAALVALKSVEFAKSRLVGLPDPLRRRLAWTMALDTLAALVEVASAVCVVSDQPALTSRLGRAGLGGVEVLAEHRPAGMNEALRQGAAHLQDAGHAAVLACVGDLPALTTTSLRTVLDAATGRGRSFLADASGTGTTMLHTDGAPLEPHFQGRSAAAHHGSGAVALSDAVLGRSVSDARRDVDTEVDLADAVRLGLGPASAALVDPETGRLGAYTVVTVVRAPNPDGRAVTAAGVRVALRAQSAGGGLRVLRAGQRLHASVGDGEVLSAWM